MSRYDGGPYTDNTRGWPRPCGCGLRARLVGDGCEACDPSEAAEVRAFALEAEIERLHTWAGLMETLDRHFPAEVFDGSSGDPGPRIIVLAREVERLRVELGASWAGVERLLGALTAARRAWVLLRPHVDMDRYGAECCRDQMDEALGGDVRARPHAGTGA